MASAILKSRPRLLVVTDDASRGGTAHVAYQLATSLCTTFEVHFACQHNKATAGALIELESEGIYLHSYELTEAAPWRNPLQSTFSSDQALDLLEASDPDVVLSFDAAELFSLAALKSAAKRCGIPFISVINILLEDCRVRFGDLFDAVVAPLAYADALIFACHAHLRRFETILPGFPVPTSVILNSRPDMFFEPRNIVARKRLRTELAVDDSALVCLTTARIEPHKGQSRIVKALALLVDQKRGANIRLVFVGTGRADHVDELQNEVLALGLESQVTILGSRTDIVDLLDASDIFILPSKSEATSLSIIEAMAKALPIVATAIDGILELIDEDCGILLPLEEDASIRFIAQAVDSLNCDKSLRARLAHAAREKANLFRVRRAAERYVDLLSEVLSRRPRSNRSFSRSISPIGTIVDFANPAQAWNILKNGWSISESEGVWSEGAFSTLELRTDGQKGQRVRLAIELAPHLPPSWSTQETAVMVDGRLVERWKFTSPGRQTRTLDIDVTEDSPTIRIRLEHSRAVSPLALGFSQDPRDLALFFYRIKISLPD